MILNRAKKQGSSYLSRWMLGWGAWMVVPAIFAADLGVIGATYPIAETDFITMAQKKIQAQLNHDPLGRWRTQQQELIKAAIDRPSPLAELHPSYQTRHWFWDPSFLIPHDVRSANGSIVLKAGARFNPLEKIHLKVALIFFDGDDPQQVAWVQKQNRRLKNRVLLILVKGSIRTVSLQFPQKQVFFDQGGRLTQRLQITQTPAIVQQVGARLKVNEVIP